MGQHNAGVAQKPWILEELLKKETTSSTWPRCRSVTPRGVQLTEACVELCRGEEAVALPVQTLKHFLQLLGGQR